MYHRGNARLTLMWSDSNVLMVAKGGCLFVYLLSDGCLALLMEVFCIANSQCKTLSVLCRPKFTHERRLPLTGYFLKDMKIPNL